MMKKNKTLSENKPGPGKNLNAIWTLNISDIVTAEEKHSVP